MPRHRRRRWILALAIVAGIVGVPQAALAERTVVVLLRGFNASQGDSGMDRLAASLEAAFGGDPARPFSSQVFNYNELQDAFDFVDGFSDVGCLIVGGHSFGGDASIELVTDFLTPAGIMVDLLVQFDSVGIGDEVLPEEVGLGLNYYQESTGFFEPQGERNVVGSINTYVEQFYGVTDFDITHTTIDCPFFDYSAAAYAMLFGSQPDLYARIEDQIAALCAVAVPALGPAGIVVLVAVLLAAARRKFTRPLLVLEAQRRPKTSANGV